MAQNAQSSRNGGVGWAFRFVDHLELLTV
jgi:hypothetical protein